MTRNHHRSLRQTSRSHVPATSRTVRGRWRTVTQVALLILLTSCEQECPGYEPPSPSRAAVTGVRVVPSVVWVDALNNDRTFALRAMLDLADGTQQEAADGEVSWSSDASAAQAAVPPSGARARVTVVSPFTQSFTVTATVAGFNSSSEIRPNPASTGSGYPTLGKMITAPHVAGALPTLAIASGWNAARNACDDTPMAFVAGVRLPVLTAPPPGTVDCRSDVAVLSPSQALWRQPVNWASGSAGLVIAAASKIEIKARVILGVTDRYCPTDLFGFDAEGCTHLTDVQQTALTRLETSQAVANALFDDAGVGVVLALDTPHALRTSLPNTTNCATLPTDPDYRPSPTQLTVYVVDNTYEPENGPMYGQACTSEQGSAILIGYAHFWLMSTLAHEVGHLLGHRSPQHVNEGITGFSSNNLMSVVEQAGVDRFVLTAGQAYRLAVDKGSLINIPSRASHPTEPCQCKVDRNSPCARLARDVSPLERTVNGAAQVCSP